MKFNNLFLVLVLIFVISLGAVSAAEDSDIETGVLATADGMSLDTAVEGDLAESGVVDESLDSSVDADSVDDDLGESEIIDENEELSMDVSMDDDLYDIFNEEGADNEYTIYVGPNTEEGDGTLENPFNDLLTAFESTYDIEEENAIVTINIFGGTYSLDSDSIYTNEYINYIIQAMPNEKVTIEGSETLSLTSDFKTSDVWTKIYGINFNCPIDFGQHMGNVELYDCVINTTQNFYFAQLLSKTATNPSRNFVNCTFIGQSSILSSANPIKEFRSHINISNCKFININSIELMGAYVFIENCLFNNVNSISG